MSSRRGAEPARAAPPAARRQQTSADYDAMAKLANNENNWGIPESVMDAMEGAWKYAGRYGYPDPGINQAIAEYDGVKAENIMLAAGSGEILSVVGVTFLQGGKKVLGVNPSYMSVYSHATSLKSEAITLPLTKDHRQDIGQMIDVAKKRQNEIGFVYIVNPNNPTGVIVTKDEVQQLIDGIPAGMPVLLDEAYHHYVDDPAYATGMPYVNQGRPVIIARTFSKIAGDGRAAHWLRRCADRTPAEDAPVLDGQCQRARALRRRRRR